MDTPEQDTLKKVCEGYAFPLDDILSEEFNRGLHVGVTWERERAKVLVEAIEIYLDRAWPERKDPLYKKLYSLQWMSHREGFLSGVMWERKRMLKQDNRMSKTYEQIGYNRDE